MSAVPTQLENALAVLARGWFTFPCYPRTKDPHGRLVPNGVLDASNSEAKVRRWWQIAPDANPAVALGASGLTAIDADTGMANRDAAREWYQRNKLPATFTVRSGRCETFAVHWYYTGVLSTYNFTHDGVSGSVRSGNSYVMAPGAIHPSGARYAILADRALAPVPQLLTKLPRVSSTRPQGDDSTKIPPSQRHYYLVERARELHYAGLRGKGLAEALRCLYLDRCVRDPEKDAKIERGEVAGIVRWIETHPPEYPLQPNDFIALRHAEKQNDLVNRAWVADLAPFDNSPDQALTHLISRLREVGCGDDQIYRIVGMSPLAELMKTEEAPEFLKDVTRE